MNSRIDYMKYPKAFWNERYAQKAYVYGRNPNLFLAEQLPKIQGTSILFPAEGEGRNAVFAAKNGWDTSAFDMSEEGQQKAKNLARSEGVEIDYSVCTAEEVEYPLAHFDCLALIYANFPPTTRKAIHEKLISYLKPAGTIIFESFSKQQLDYQQKYDSGGPKDANMLFSEAELRSEFPAINMESIETTELVLSEGAFHDGLASVVRFVGKKA